VSRGPGKTQHAILATLGPKHPSSTSDLAEAVGADHRQVRAAVASLEDRGLVVCRRNCCIGYRKDHQTVRYQRITVNIGSEPVTFIRYGVPPKVVITDLPIKGTLVWSLDGWEAECDIRERAAAAGGYRLSRNHRDRADPAHTVTRQ